MKKLLLFVLLFPAFLIAVGAPDTVITSGKWSVAANWSSGALPQALIDTMLHKTATNDTIDSSFSLAAVRIPPVSGTWWSLAGKTLAVNDFFIDSGTGTARYPDTLIINGASGYLRTSAGNGARTATNSVLVFNGTTGMSYVTNKLYNTTMFCNVILGASAKLTVTGTQTFYIGSTASVGALLTMGNNSTLTISSGSGAGLRMDFQCHVTPVTTHSIGSGCTINGTSGVAVVCYLGGSTITVPALTLSGTTQYFKTYFATHNNTINLTGNLSITGNIQIDQQYYATTGNVFNTGGFSLSGLIFYGGSGLTAAAQLTVNMSSSTVTCTQIIALTSVNYTTGFYKLNFDQSQWSVAGDVTMDQYWTVNPGTTAKITVTNTSNITSAGKSLPELALNATGKAITFIDKFRTIGDLTLTAGKITPFKGRDSVLGNYYNNLTAAADTVNRIDTLYLFGSYTRASGSHAKNDTAQTMICGTALCNWTSSGFTANMVRLIGTNRTKQLKLIDNSIFKFLKDSTGTINTNGKKLTCDSSLFIVDSLFTSAGDTITTPKLLVSSSAKLNINSSLFYFGLALKDTLYDSCTSSLGKIVVNKSGNGLVQSGNSYSRKMELTDGSFDLASIGDSIVTDTLNVTTTDTVTLKYIHLTGTHPTLVLGTGAKIGFLSGAKIIVDVCNTFDLTNDWGGVVPTICYPPTGPFSFAAPPVAVVGSAITPFSAVNSGCGFDSCRISPALSGGLSIGTGANEGEVSGTPTETKAATLYTVVYVNNGVSGKYRDSATFTLTVNPALPAISYSIPAKCTQGVNRSFSMSNTGGPADSVKVVVGSLLSAIICNKTTGTIDGVPATTQAVATDTVQAWNVTGSSKTPFTYTVYGCLIGLSYGAQTADTVAKAISTLSPTFGGCTPDSLNFAAFTITGLSGNHSTGAITGTPTIAGHDSVRVVSYAGVKTDSAVGYAVITSHGGATATAVPASGSSTGATIKIYWRGAFTSTGIGGTISGTALTSLTRITADSATAVIPVLSAGVKIIRVGNNLGDSASANYEVLPSITGTNTGTKRFRFGFGFGF